MTAIDLARLDFELHGNRLERALGRGGARADLDLARAELDAVAAALDVLRNVLAEHGSARP